MCWNYALYIYLLIQSLQKPYKVDGIIILILQLFAKCKLSFKCQAHIV